MSRERTGWSERVRELAREQYIEPMRGKAHVIRIPYGELKTKLVRMGFPANHANQVATPLEADKFLKPLGLELLSPKGQPRTIGSVLEFRFADAAETRLEDPQSKEERIRRAMAAADELRGMLKDEIAAFGGAEAFIRWVRSDEDEDPA